EIDSREQEEGQMILWICSGRDKPQLTHLKSSTRIVMSSLWELPEARPEKAETESSKRTTKLAAERFELDSRYCLQRSLPNSSCCGPGDSTKPSVKSRQREPEATDISVKE